MEESAELLERLKSGKNLPLFTSCCPGWVKFCENRYPGILRGKIISTCRSPQAMFGALLKEEARMKAAEAGKRRTEPPQDCCDLDYAMYGQKKAEIKRPEQFYRRAAGCRLCTDHDRSDPYDQRSGNGSVADRTGGTGYAVWSVFRGQQRSFGVTGGVTEAVLRRLVHSSRMEDLQDISFTGIRGIEGIKEASIQLEDRTVENCSGEWSSLCRNTAGEDQSR